MNAYSVNVRQTKAPTAKPLVKSKVK